MRTHLALAALLSLPLSTIAHAGPNQPQVAVDPPAGGRVDLVIALDTSGSMDGLIDGARQRLWDVVGLLAQAKPKPTLRVGVISYGNDSYGAAAGWVRKDLDLSSDLDSVYAKLFALRTNGGTEYVARAVKVSLEQMQWDQSPKALRILFVAGNEAANQDPQLPVESVVQAAREKGIFVNTLYCGSPGAHEAGLWQRVAGLGGGQYAAIDHNRHLAIVTPMDAELARLSGELNRTYVGYGRGSGSGLANQMAQDKNAAAASPPAAASRAVAKASALYANDEWDLVDARKAKKADVSALKAEELPAEMRNLKPAERATFLDQKAKEREQVQQKIQTLAKQREDFLRKERSKAPAAKSGDLGGALDGMIRTEAQSKGFSF